MAEEKHLRKSGDLTIQTGGSLVGGLLKITVALIEIMGHLKEHEQKDQQLWGKLKADGLDDGKARRTLRQQYQEKWNGSLPKINLRITYSLL